MSKIFNTICFHTILLLAFVAILSSSISAQALSEKEQKQNWKLLFNGENFEGWRGVNKLVFPEKGWTVRNNSIVCTGEKGGSIVTTEKYGNFELEWEWRLFVPGANSGLKYFVAEQPGDTGGYGYGIEYQMLDDGNHEWMLSGKMTPNDYHTLGSAYELYPASPNKKAKKLGKWNHSKIVSVDGQIEHWLNGKKILEFDRFSADFKQKIAASKFKDIENYGIMAEGHILLQDHDSEVNFRNLKIRKL